MGTPWPVHPYFTQGIPLSPGTLLLHTLISLPALEWHISLVCSNYSYFSRLFLLILLLLLALGFLYCGTTFGCITRLYHER